jgi:uncharacterized protein DUF4386
MRAADTSTGSPSRPELQVHEIRVQGHLDARHADWLDDLTLSHESDGTTTLTSRPTDQAALHGVLGRVRDLGLPIVSVRRVAAASAAGPASPRRLARLAGLLYLVNGVASGFAYGYVSARMYVAGDAAATAGNVVANAGLVRVGVVADLLQATVFVFLAMALYLLLKHVDKHAASAMVLLVAIASTIMCLNEVFQFGALLVATEPSRAAAFGVDGSHGLVLLLLDLHHYGFLIAQIFFGLWLVPLGYLAYRSGMFPRPLGVVLIVGGVCYLVDLLALFLAPALGNSINAFVIIPPTIAEVSMVVYLLVKGVRSLSLSA